MQWQWGWAVLGGLLFWIVCELQQIARRLDELTRVFRQQGGVSDQVQLIRQHSELIPVRLTAIIETLKKQEGSV